MTPRHLTARPSQRKYFALATSWLALSIASTLSASTITLDFNAPESGTLNDQNGMGTGFTSRLPGTGSAIPVNDPNLNLDTANSQLVLQSTYSSPNYANAGLQNNAANLVGLDAPTLQLSGIGTGNFIVRAQFNNLNLPAPSDEIGVLVGASISNVVRGGTFWDTPSVGNSAGFNYAQNGFDGPPTNGATGTFQPGQDGEFELGRINGVWHFSWHNLSTGNGDTYGNFSVPGLDSQNDLYVGIFNLDPYGYAPSPYNAYLESFSVLTGASVPEPASIVLFGAGAVVVFFAARRKAKLRLTTERARQ
jgi:hypothetical protein